MRWRVDGDPHGRRSRRVRPSSKATIATGSRRKSSASCVRPTNASASASEGEQVVASRRGGDRRLHREHGPDERRVRRDLGQQERREQDPRHHDREQGDGVRDPAPSGHPSRKQVGRDAGRRHDPGVQRVRGPEAVLHVAPAERGRDEHGVELVERRDELAAYPRQHRQVPRHADRPPLVQQLVRHREPVGDSRRDRASATESAHHRPRIGSARRIRPFSACAGATSVGAHGAVGPSTAPRSAR